MYVFLLRCFIETRVFNSVDLDQMPRSMAFNLGPRCLPMSLSWDARHAWVNVHSSQMVVNSYKLAVV